MLSACCCPQAYLVVSKHLQVSSCMSRIVSRVAAGSLYETAVNTQHLIDLSADELINVVAPSASSLLTAPNDSPVTAPLCPSYVRRQDPDKASQAFIVVSLDPVRKVTLSIARTFIATMKKN